ncbi:MAG TPA: hypothetical protein VNP03_05860 [Pseudonocardia sp.]|nr:hypothetical protein [Pseudonocardia sp.]
MQVLIGQRGEQQGVRDLDVVGQDLGDAGAAGLGDRDQRGAASGRLAGKTVLIPA